MKRLLLVGKSSYSRYNRMEIEMRNVRMSFDGVFTHVIEKELNQELQSGRLTKIHQPYDHEIVLIIRNNGKNHKLLLSVNPTYARVHLTKMTYQNPSSPTNFCMMLRKYLEGAILEKIAQKENDRVLHFSFSRRNEVGDLENIVLVVELMGRHSTIVLLNKENHKILDCIKHVGLSQNSYRILLPGAEYIEPPKQSQQNPFKTNHTNLFETLSTTENLDANYLQQHFQGLGKDTATELAFQLAEHPNEKMKTWQSFWGDIENSPVPTLSIQGNKDFFTPLLFTTLGRNFQTFSSASELVDAFYEGKAEKDRVKQQSGDLVKKIANEKKKNELKIKKLEQTIQDAENAEQYRIKGELLTTYLYQVGRGAKKVTLPNYYEEEQPIEIGLNPALSPNQNAQKYFQRYQKLKNGNSIVKEQLAHAQKEVNYLESVLSQLEIATPQEIPFIREELIQERYLRLKTGKKKHKQSKPSQPEKFISSDGTSLLVGKNNLQNDQLTLKTARKTDVWLHAKDIPGSHVIIQSSEPSVETLHEAAQLAAYYSKYRLSSSVPVDYVAVKHVHKPNGAKPGFVIYENQKTLFVTPEKTTIEQLKKA